MRVCFGLPLARWGGQLDYDDWWQAMASLRARRASRSLFLTSVILALAASPAMAQDNPSCDEVNGVADFHMHQFANLSFGGNIFHGATYDEDGISAALGDCSTLR